MKIPSVIAIDGPAAAGKSTLGQLLAEGLGYLYFDTGVMYRAVTVLALLNDISLTDEEALTDLIKRMNVRILPPTVEDGRQYTVLANEQDITWLLRMPEADLHVSRVSRFPHVREALHTQFRRIGSQGNIVMVGRDIGAVVMPNADIKVFLDASLAERARRRQHELRTRNHFFSFEEVMTDLCRRDEIDQSYSYLTTDSHYITTDNVSPAELVELILNRCKLREEDGSGTFSVKQSRSDRIAET